MNLVFDDLANKNKFLFLFLFPFALLLISYTSSLFFYDIHFFFYLSLIFSSCILNIFLSTYLIVFRNSNYFLYLFNLLFILGTVLKLFLYKSFPIFLREPIGLFKDSGIQTLNIMDVVFTSCLSISLAFFLILYFGSNVIKEKNTFSIKPTSAWVIVFFFIILLFLAFINYKFNILMLGLTPSLQLPLYGNALFFIFLTRALPFLFLYVCFNIFNRSPIFTGALFFLIISAATLSRMGIAIYFLVLIFTYVRFWEPNKINLFNILKLALPIFVIIYLAVGFSSSARNHFYSNSGSLSSKDAGYIESIYKISSTVISPETTKMLTSLTLARWVGLEGIMAVEAYPKKGFALFLEALLEPPYKGDSFYNRILSSEKKIITGKTITTSVPGPIAFFYYSGNLMLLFILLFFFLLMFSLLENIFWKYFSEAFAPGCFVVVLTVIDFHQFGIAPLSFFKYLIFTIFCLIIFYPIKKYIPRVQYE